MSGSRAIDIAGARASAFAPAASSPALRDDNAVFILAGAVTEDSPIAERTAASACFILGALFALARLSRVPNLAELCLALLRISLSAPARLDALGSGAMANSAIALVMGFCPTDEACCCTGTVGAFAVRSARSFFEGDVRLDRVRRGCLHRERRRERQTVPDVKSATSDQQGASPANRNSRLGSAACAPPVSPRIT